jgi:hypothetical protein
MKLCDSMVSVGSIACGDRRQADIRSSDRQANSLNWRYIAITLIFP